MFKENRSNDLGARNGVQKFNIGIYRKNYIFDFFSELLGQFQPNLARIITRGWVFRFVQMVSLVPRVLDLGAQKGETN